MYTVTTEITANAILISKGSRELDSQPVQGYVTARYGYQARGERHYYTRPENRRYMPARDTARLSDCVAGIAAFIRSIAPDGATIQCNDHILLPLIQEALTQGEEQK